MDDRNRPSVVTVCGILAVLGVAGNARAQPVRGPVPMPSTQAAPSHIDRIPVVAPRCCDGRVWIQAAENGPQPREFHEMAFDYIRGRTVLFGGSISSGYLGDTWVLTGSVWTLAATTGPSPRNELAMVYDASRERVVLFGGGHNNSNRMGDTWEWDGATWALRSTSGPSARVRHVMAYDRVRNVTVMFGGYAGGSVDQGDTWEWNGTSWTLRATTGPSPRESATMAYDPVRRRTVLFGGFDGNRLGDTWEWNGVAWTQIPGSGPTPRSNSAMVWEDWCGRMLLFGGYSATNGPEGDTWLRVGTTWIKATDAGPIARFGMKLAYDSDRHSPVLFGGYAYDIGVHGDTWVWRCPCDEDVAAPLNGEGNVILPPDLDPTEPVVYSDVDQQTGNVSDIYKDYFSSMGDWYGKLPCGWAIGGELPPEAENPDLQQQLEDLGITGVTPQQLSDAVDLWEAQVDAAESYKTNPLPTAPPVPAGYLQPVSPHCAKPDRQYVFGGRDIVFVHGLDGGALNEKILGEPLALTTWPEDREEFYGSGYWKMSANYYWHKHINYFLTQRNFKNRYLIVCWPSTQRLEYAVEAVLDQINQAMLDGTGVVDPSGDNCTSKFGSPSFVIVDHSTGALVSEVAMSAAANDLNLGAKHISDHCKAIISLHGAISGSQYATAIVAGTGLVEFGLGGAPPWLCALIQVLYAGLPSPGSTLTTDCDLSAILDSILVDLIPLVAQHRWGPYIQTNPVRVTTVTGGHPTMLAGLKHILAAGYDDGALTVNSQDGNPQSALFWPGGFIATLPGFINVYHMGLPAIRAIAYYIDQKFHRGFLVGVTAGGPIPVISPAGMIQDAADIDPLFDARLRYPRHYSYTFSASDHWACQDGEQYGYVGNKYADSGSHPNNEETLAIGPFDQGIFVSYPMPYPGDNEPILRPGKVPPQVEIVRGKKITFTIKIFGKKYTKSWWLWKRTFHLLEGWQSKVECDYVYDRLLSEGYPCDCVADFNGDGAINFEDEQAFIEAWLHGDQRADLNGDGRIDNEDYFLFLRAMDEGCC